MYNTIVPNKTGWCRTFINYLEKEQDLSKEFVNYLDKESALHRESSDFFDGTHRGIDKEEVVRGIDNNCKGLKKSESRFFSMTLNPSAREIEFLRKLAAEQVQDFKQQGWLIKDANMEEAFLKDYLRQYTVKCMDEYARHFGREGIHSNRDLVWYGRIEGDRYWKRSSKEVQFNRNIDRRIKELQRSPKSLRRDRAIQELKKQYILESDVRKDGKHIPVREMMPKSGVNYHVHIIVSRRDRTQSMSLSPLAKARSNEQHKINGRECKIGFDRDAFTQKVEQIFDRSFEYQRSFADSYEGRKTMKYAPELYAAKEAEYNLSHGIETQERQNYSKEQSQHPERIITGLTHKMAYEAGLNYVNDSIRPHRELVDTGIKGIKILACSTQRKRETVQLCKSATHAFVKGVGLSGAAVQPYLLAAGIMRKMVAGFSREEN